MNITEVRVKLMRNRSDRLRAFCSITIDGDFVVHDLRVIEGRKGLFVAMPSRKLTDNCSRCGAKNELGAKFCGECGTALARDRAERTSSEKSHVDVAHPINTPCREMLQNTVLAAYKQEDQRASEGLPPMHDDSAAGPDAAADERGEADYEDWTEPTPAADYEGPRAEQLGPEETLGLDLDESTELLVEQTSPESDASEQSQQSGPERKPEEAPPRKPRLTRNAGAGGFGDGIF